MKKKPTAPLTRREQFAMAAMQGLLSHPDFVRQADDDGCNRYAAVALDAVIHADALIDALDGEPPEEILRKEEPCGSGEVPCP